MPRLPQINSRFIFLPDTRVALTVRSAVTIAFFLFVFLITESAWRITVRAQSATATLSGVITDQNGDVVPGVNVSVINIAQGFQRTTTSNDQGNFVVPLLPPGTYIVKAERERFTTAEVRDLILNVNDQVSIKIQLKVGSLQSPIVDVVDTSLINESPAVATIIDRQFVDNMPMNGRSFQVLITLTPGVVLTKANVNGQGQFSVNGQRSDANYFSIDGTSANISVSTTANLNQNGGGALPGVSATGGFNNLVSMDAMQEFKIQTSTYAPEFGRTPGAQVSIITRSGTNDFRGSVFEYFRNDVLDANDWFANSRGQTSPMRQNDFGFVIGGPVVLPGFGNGGPALYNGRNKTFFFVSYEGLRLRQPSSQITEVPSMSARQNAAQQIKPFLNAFPVPNGRDFGNGKAEFSGGYSDPATLDATSVRIDQNASSKLNFFGRYNHAPSGIDQRGVAQTFSLNTITVTRSTTDTLTLGSTLSLSAAAINELRVNYSRNSGNNFTMLDNYGGAVPLSDSLLFPPFASSQDSKYFFLLNGVTSGLLSSGKNVTNLQRQFNLVDNFSFVSSSHQLKFGVDYRRMFPIFDELKYQLAVTFLSMSSALTGIADSVAITGDVGPRFPVFNNLSLYAQDNFRVTPALTLTYGLRWELDPPPFEGAGNPPFAVTGIENLATLALAPRGKPLYRTTYGNFAPRFGIAYQLSARPGRETMLRGGIGIFYDLGYGSVANAFTRFPYTSNKPLTNVSYPITAAQATPAPFPDPTNPVPPLPSFAVVDPNLELPRTYQWNLAIEQSLGSNQQVSATYVAAVGRKLLRSELLFLSSGLNPALFNSASRVTLTRNAATSDYHAMQLQFQRRLSKGFQALASYTWAHSLDNVSDDLPGVPINKFDPQDDRGPSDFDVRHSFNAAVTYSVRFKETNSFLKGVFRDWFADTIFTARTATPVNVVVTRNLGFGSFSFRPDLVQGVPLYRDDTTVGGGRRINAAAFAIPIGRQGTLGRNAFRGFSVAQVDLALRRQFKLTERLSLQLRGEAFNIFNHPNFGDPNGLLGSASTTGVLTPNSLFGQSTQMLGRSLGSGGLTGGFNPLYQVGGPRSIQLAVKLKF